MLRCRAKRLLSWHYEGENSLAPSTLEWPPTFHQTSIGVNLIGWRQYDCEVQIRVSLGENISNNNYRFGWKKMFLWGFNRTYSCYLKVTNVRLKVTNVRLVTYTLVRYKELYYSWLLLHAKDSEFRPMPGHQRESPSDFHQFCW